MRVDCIKTDSSLATRQCPAAPPQSNLKVAHYAFPQSCFPHVLSYIQTFNLSFFESFLLLDPESATTTLTKRILHLA